MKPNMEVTRPDEGKTYQEKKNSIEGRRVKQYYGWKDILHPH